MQFEFMYMVCVVCVNEQHIVVACTEYNISTRKHIEQYNGKINYPTLKGVWGCSARSQELRANV